jgi:multiple sugar transport system substrate-binding protein
MKAHLFISFILSLVLLTACLSSAADNPPAPSTIPPTPEPDPVTITWAFWGDPWEVEINQRIVEIFEADHPYIQVETFHRSWNDYFVELRPRLDAGERVPDVLFWSEVTSDVPKGYFMDLAPLMEAENYRLNDFFPGLLVHFKVGDSIYGLPRDSDTKIIFYNKRLFNRANLPFPRAGWTWDDVRATSLAIKEANVTEYSFAYEANDWWMIWMWQNGVQLFDDKLFPTQTGLGDPAAAQAVQFLADLTNVDQITPPYEQLNSTDISSLFAEGKLAMAFGNHALVPAFAEIEDFEWDVVELPHQKRHANLAAGAGYVIAANTPHVEAAWTFLKFLTSPKVQAIFAESGLAVPARRSVARSDVFLEQRPLHDAAVFLSEAEIGEPNFAFPGADKIMALMNEALIPVWRGEQDAASAIKAVLPQIEQIVAESRERL